VANCIFCERAFGSGRKRSGEHAFPKWTANALPGKSRRVKHTYTPFMDAGSEYREWTADGYALVAKVVCRPCNHGWMDTTIERPARPHLWPIIQGAAVTLTEGACERIANWGLKTAMMIDMCHRPEGRSVPAGTYPELFAVQNVLPHTFVWLGAWDAGSDALGRNGSLHIDVGEASLAPMWFGLVAIGHMVVMLVVRARADYEKGLQITGDLGASLLPIWPYSEPVTWPPGRPAFDRDALDMLPIMLPVSEALKTARL
jgi:hypothetical protein